MFYEYDFSSLQQYISLISDDISLCSPREIDNIEIGRFFHQFQGTHYVPNKYLEQNYPSDTAVILKYLRKNKNFLR